MSRALLGNSTDRASRCDEFINPRFAEVPGCTDPNRGSGAGWKTTYRQRRVGVVEDAADRDPPAER